MLTLFCARVRFLAAFCVLAAFVLVLGRFFCVLERSRIDFGGSWGHLGKVWEVPRAYFSMFLRAHVLALRKGVGCAKTTVFPRFFLGFKNIAHVARKTKNRTISLLKPVEQSSPPKSCSELVLERAGLYLGGIWGSFVCLLDVSWPAFGCSWVAFDPSWALLGRLLDAFGRHLAHLKRLLGAF